MSMNVCPESMFWIVEPFTTKFGMVMHHCEPECLSERLLFCLQGQGQNKDFMMKIWLSCIFSELLILLRLNWVWWQLMISWIVLWRDWIALLWSKSQGRFKIPVNVHLDNISSAEPFVTILGAVMHHHGPECHARWVHCLQGHHSEGS